MHDMPYTPPFGLSRVFCINQEVYIAMNDHELHRTGTVQTRCVTVYNWGSHLHLQLPNIIKPSQITTLPTSPTSSSHTPLRSPSARSERHGGGVLFQAALGDFGAGEVAPDHLLPARRTRRPNAGRRIGAMRGAGCGVLPRVDPEVFGIGLEGLRYIPFLYPFVKGICIT